MISRLLPLSLLILIFVVVVKSSDGFSIQSKSWDFKGHSIGYEEAKQVNVRNEQKSSDPILLLNGFGVGSFHQHRIMPHLSNEHSAVFGIDYLGQGRSWPVDCDDGNSENERALIYSIDTWADQVIAFIEEIIRPAHEGRKVHLIGNSVGGHLSVVLAAKRPDLIESICLLNATPVWGLNLKGWSGHLPPPMIPRKIGRYLFDKIRDMDTIEKYLENAYATREAFDEKLMKDIRGCTEGKGGHAAFASIMWSAPATFPEGNPQGFYDNLSALECDVLLLFGNQDPWCTPAFAKRMFQSLKERAGTPTAPKPVHRYVAIENCGHCPNHEAPTAVAQIVNRWTGSKDRSRNMLSLLDGEKQIIEEPWATTHVSEVSEDNISLSLMDKIITTFV
mmetsp:Transcript_16620/g.24929  ORF Transcript_16620/g.24929 Transcript_16620/m.24929 type:complete len:391 (-) Transcript_16620:131-1303(-)|eukprot:CAMPEP_0194086356 /NCGR_PEP_ID=MMETSP0149-20130528/20854_1 /TAXON_ID=122233 /ORGANISM="Chaetoceros debilis, Strain MM31A-1" /LENGTH=390 /DNA_ID=CAMNT_0038769433 /DNA_START=31 /DNA_END=1203 /DNA_ORIENTATION=-